MMYGKMKEAKLRQKLDETKLKHDLLCREIQKCEDAISRRLGHQTKVKFIPASQWSMKLFHERKD